MGNDTKKPAMKPEKQQHKHTANLASHVPGRLRIKLSPACRAPHVMGRIGDSLREKDGIHKVRLNDTTGSVTITYDHRKLDREGIYQILDDVDVIISDLTGAPQVEEPTAAAGKKEAPLTFISAAEDLNKRLSEITGVKVDLKTALPLSLVGLGIWSIARSGLGLDKIPGVLFLWLAFDAFHKLHPHPHPVHS